MHHKAQLYPTLCYSFFQWIQIFTHTGVWLFIKCLNWYTFSILNYIWYESPYHRNNCTGIMQWGAEEGILHSEIELKVFNWVMAPRLGLPPATENQMRYNVTLKWASFHSVPALRRHHKIVWQRLRWLTSKGCMFSIKNKICVNKEDAHKGDRWKLLVDFPEPSYYAVPLQLLWKDLFIFN